MGLDTGIDLIAYGIADWYCLRIRAEHALSSNHFRFFLPGRSIECSRVKARGTHVLAGRHLHETTVPQRFTFRLTSVNNVENMIPFFMQPM